MRYRSALELATNRLGWVALGLVGTFPLTDPAITNVETVQRGAHGVMGNRVFASPDALQLPPMNLQELGISHIAPSVLVADCERGKAKIHTQPQPTQDSGLGIYPPWRTPDSGLRAAGKMRSA